MKRIKKSAEEKLSQQIKFSLPSDQKGNSSANKPEKCPKCGSAKVVPIVYGEPSPELARKAFYKEIYLDY